MEVAEDAHRPVSPPGVRAPACYSLAEVARHCTQDDGWIVVSDKVYDITPFVKTHVGWSGGGKVSTLLAILRNLGKDCTEEFNEVHDKHGKRMLQDFYIGRLRKAGGDGTAVLDCELDKMSADTTSPKSPPMPESSVASVGSSRDPVTSGGGRITELPKDCLLKILYHLQQPADIVAVSATCQRFWRLYKSGEVIAPCLLSIEAVRRVVEEDGVLQVSACKSSGSSGGQARARRRAASKAAAVQADADFTVTKTGKPGTQTLWLPLMVPDVGAYLELELDGAFQGHGLQVGVAAVVPRNTSKPGYFQHYTNACSRRSVGGRDASAQRSSSIAQRGGGPAVGGPLALINPFRRKGRSTPGKGDEDGGGGDGSERLGSPRPGGKPLVQVTSGDVHALPGFQWTFFLDGRAAAATATGDDRTPLVYGHRFHSGDRLGIVYRRAGGTVGLCRNGRSLGVAFDNVYAPKLSNRQTPLMALFLHFCMAPGVSVRVPCSMESPANVRVDGFLHRISTGNLPPSPRRSLQSESSVATGPGTMSTRCDFTLRARIVGADDTTFVRVRFRDNMTLGELRSEVAKHTAYQASQIDIAFGGQQGALARGEDDTLLRDLGKSVTREGIEVGGEILCNIPLLIS